MWQPAALRWCALLVSLLLVLHPLSVFSEEHESDYDRIDPHAPLGDDGTQGGTTGREHTEEGHYSAEDERSNETWDDVYYMDFDDYEYMAEKCAFFRRPDVVVGRTACNVPTRAIVSAVRYLGEVMAWDPEDADYESLADLQRLAPLFSTKIRALKMGSWRGPIVQDCLADLLLDAKVLCYLTSRVIGNEHTTLTGSTPEEACEDLIISLLPEPEPEPEPLPVETPPPPPPLPPPKRKPSILMRIIRAIIRFVRDVIRWTVYIIKEIVVDIIWITIMLPWLILKTILSLPRLMKRLVLALRQTAISSFSALEHLTRAAHRVPMAPEGLHISLGTASLATRTFLANFMTIVAHTIALPRYTVLLLWRVWTGALSLIDVLRRVICTSLSLVGLGCSQYGSDCMRIFS